MLPKLLLRIAALILAVGGAAYAAEVLTLPKGGSFILPAVEAHAVFNQCSRPAPQGTQGYWEPGQTDIDVLEAKLPRYLATVPLQPYAGSYNRQYAGYRINKARYIYGNYYPAGTTMPEKQASVPVIVCDGGSSFWGIVYRPDTQQFEQLQFNGVGR